MNWPGDARAEYQRAWDSAAWLFAGLGLALRLWIAGCVPKGTSGRNAARQIAETLNTTGPYSLVRHPLYVANLLMWLAVALCSGSAVWVVISVGWFAFTYERIAIVEEDFLERRFGEQFTTWARSTPAFVPAFSGWRTSALAYSWRTALRREYSGLLGVLAAMWVVHTARLYSLDRGWVPEMPWTVLLMFGATAYVVLRTLKRRTEVLHVEGR